MSKYAANLVRDRSKYGAWPQGYWENVYGCLDDETFSVNDDDLALTLDDDCDWFGEGADVPA